MASKRKRKTDRQWERSVMSCLHFENGMTANCLQQMLNTQLATVYYILRRLISRGHVKISGKTQRYRKGKKRGANLYTIA